MKNQNTKTLFIILSTSIISILAYQWVDSKYLSTAKDPKEEKFIPPAIDTNNQVPLEMAINHIGEYVTWWNCIPDSNSVEGSSVTLKDPDGGTLAYTINLDDIVDALVIPGDKESILGMFKYKKMRAYMGIEGLSAHLYIVAIDEKGNDVIPEGEDGNRFVYDLTTPCPNSCDKSSPLYIEMNQ